MLKKIAGPHVWLVLLACFWLLAGCGGAGSVTPVQLDVQPLQEHGYVPLDNINEQKLGPGDVLEITYSFAYSDQAVEYRIQVRDTVAVKFPSMPNLNSTQAVRPDGNISLPYVGDIKVLGQTPQASTEMLRKAYRNVLWNPDVYLELATYGENLQELKQMVTSSSLGQTKQFIVRDDGKATLLVIGELDAAGKTVAELTAEATTAYRAKFGEIHVDISLRTPAAKRYYVLGEVRSPGGYSTDRPITTLELLAMAGGASPNAVLSEAILMRRQGQTLVARRTDMKSVLKLKDGAQLTYIEPGDVLFIPKSVISDVAEIMTMVQQITMFRGASITFGYDLYRMAPED
jgi:polysaccharide export outer membrane protein